MERVAYRPRASLDGPGGRPSHRRLRRLYERLGHHVRQHLKRFQRGQLCGVRLRARSELVDPVPIDASGLGRRYHRRPDDLPGRTSSDGPRA